jgi:hypothetical protein
MCSIQRQWNKAFDGNWLNIDIQFPSRLYDDLVKFTGMHIVPHKINVNRQARTAQQGQCASTDQGREDEGGTRSPKACKMD